MGVVIRVVNMDQKTRFPIELDQFKDYRYITIEDIKDENWRTLAEELMGETEENRIEGIRTLKKLAMDEKLELPFLQDEKISFKDKVILEHRFWMMVLRSGGMNPEDGLKVLKNCLSMMKDYPQYFASSNPPTKLDYVFQQKIHTMLEHRDQYGRRVYIYRPGKWNPDKSNFNEVFCVGYALSELVALETKTQIAGVTTIADAKDFGFHQLRSFTLDNARSAASFVQDSFPLWFRDIHVINAPRLFFIAFNIVRPFLNERIKKSIYFHDSNESLHEHVPKEILPTELGGLSGSYDNSACAQATFNIEQHFAHVQNFVAANSLKK